MTTAHMDGQVTAPGDAYRALLAVSEALVSHRDSSARSSSPGPALQVPLGDVEIGSQKSEVRSQRSEVRNQ